MGLRVGGGTEETGNSTSHSALGDYPTGEKGEKKKTERKKKRRWSREDQRMKTTFLYLQIFLSVKKKKRHFLIRPILIFYLVLWAIFLKNGSYFSLPLGS